MDIKIDKELKTPIYMQVSSEIKGQIMSGNISAGSILPSERALAKMLNIHRNTIIAVAHKVYLDQTLQLLRERGTE